MVQRPRNTATARFSAVPPNICYWYTIYQKGSKHKAFSCTTMYHKQRWEAVGSSMGSAGKPQILLRRILSMVVYVINYLILWRYYGNFTKSGPRGIHGMVFYY